MKKKWQKLFAEAKAKYGAAVEAAESGDMEQYKALMVEAEALEEQAKALKAASAGMDRLSQGSLPAALPVDDNGGTTPGPDVGGEAEDVIVKAVNVLRYGKPDDDPTAKVMREVYGGDYRQLFFEQERAFTHYLRTGEPAKALKRQMWNVPDVISMLKYGCTVVEIKTTMIEGQDTLGGYAVPPQRAADIVRRLPGLTAVRGGGATVVQTASNAIEWLALTGGGDQYPTGLRGAWGTEVQDPLEKNITYGLETITVDTYTYKLSMSQSLVEDASNLLAVVMEEIVVTLAIDEDDACLIGDGAGKPRGILPSSANANSLTEVNSGDANALKWDGLKALRRGVASQYRAMGRASWIGESDTGGDIERFEDGNGRNYVDILEAGERVPTLGGTWRESESMPAVAADAFPLIFGDLSGYKIIERLGLAIVRFQDSGTGINKVEYHVRRRIGGRLIDTWKLAVQKVSA